MVAVSQETFSNYSRFAIPGEKPFEGSSLPTGAERSAQSVNLAKVNDMSAEELVWRFYEDDEAIKPKLVSKDLYGETQLLNQFASRFRDERKPSPTGAPTSNNRFNFDYQKFSNRVKRSEAMRTLASKATGIPQSEITPEIVLSVLYKLADAIKGEWAKGISQPPTDAARARHFKQKFVQRMDSWTESKKPKFDPGVASFTANILCIYHQNKLTLNASQPSSIPGEENNPSPLTPKPTLQILLPNGPAQTNRAVAPSQEEMRKGQLMDYKAMLENLRYAKAVGGKKINLGNFSMSPTSDSPLGVQHKKVRAQLKQLSNNPQFRAYCHREGMDPDSVSVMGFGSASYLLAHIKGDLNFRLVFDGNDKVPSSLREEVQNLKIDTRGVLFSNDDNPNAIELNVALGYYGIHPSNPRTGPELDQTIRALDERITSDSRNNAVLSDVKPATTVLPIEEGAAVEKKDAPSSDSNTGEVASKVAEVVIIGGAAAVVVTPFVTSLTAAQKAGVVALGNAAIAAGGTLLAVCAPGAMAILGAGAAGGNLYSSTVSFLTQHGIAENLAKNAAFIEVGGVVILVSIGGVQTYDALKTFADNPSWKSGLNAAGNLIATLGTAASGVPAIKNVGQISKKAKYGWLSDSAATKIGDRGNQITVPSLVTLFATNLLPDNAPENPALAPGFKVPRKPPPFIANKGVGVPIGRNGKDWT